MDGNRLPNNGTRSLNPSWPTKGTTIRSPSGFNKTQVNPFFFVKKFDGGDHLILLLYFDDMLIVDKTRRKLEV